LFPNRQELQVLQQAVEWRQLVLVFQPPEPQQRE
jgi:hypothetical protein